MQNELYDGRYCNHVSETSRYCDDRSMEEIINEGGNPSRYETYLFGSTEITPLTTQHLRSRDSSVDRDNWDNLVWLSEKTSAKKG